MRNLILKIAGSSQRLTNLLPQTANSATICGQTGCGKSFHLGSARRPLPGVLLTHRSPVPVIGGLLPCSGEQLRNDEGTAGDSLVSPDACSGETAGQQQLLRNDKVTEQTAVQDRVQNYRERLASVAAGGQVGRYGLLAYRKSLTASHIEELDDSEIERLYARYEARLGAAITKTLGFAALQLYAGVVSTFLPIPAENQPGLIADLEGDTFVGHVLSSAACELYHRYGLFLAPLTAALTTIKHCQFGHRCSAVINDGNQAVGGEPAGSSGGPARRNSFARGPAHSPVERVTDKKAKDPKKVQALPPGKNDCSNSFRRPRNHYVHQSAQLTTTARLLLQRKRSRQNAQTNGQNITITGSDGS